MSSGIALADDQVPVQWNGIDIGGPSPAGSSLAINSVFTLRGGGGTLAGSKDQFRFIHQCLTGACVLTARLSAGANACEGKSAGLMARQALEDGPGFNIAQPEQAEPLTRR